jgi:hypothetical protein
MMIDLKDEQVSTAVSATLNPVIKLAMQASRARDESERREFETSEVLSFSTLEFSGITEILELGNNPVEHPFIYQ